MQNYAERRALGLGVRARHSARSFPTHLACQHLRVATLCRHLFALRVLGKAAGVFFLLHSKSNVTLDPTSTRNLSRGQAVMRWVPLARALPVRVQPPETRLLQQLDGTS